MGGGISAAAHFFDRKLVAPAVAREKKGTEVW